MTATPGMLAEGIVKAAEGCHLQPYYCPGGFPTIGWGRLLSRDKEAPLSNWESIDQQTADRYLHEDMRWARQAVARLFGVPLTAGQEAALIDFAYNAGGANLQASTLRRVVNREDYGAAPDQFMRWVYAKKRRWNGLIRRRSWEVREWLGSQAAYLDWLEEWLPRHKWAWAALGRP